MACLNLNPDLKLVYFDMGIFYIRLECVENFSKLDVSIQRNMTYPYELESGVITTISSLKEIYYY